MSTMTRVNPLAYKVEEDEWNKITKLYYVNDYSRVKTLIDCFPWIVWGRQGAFEAANKAKRKVEKEVPL